MSQLDELIKETRAAFIIAKSDGVLDAGEVISIAVALVQKIHKLSNVSGDEKKALLLHTLQKGLTDSGGLDSLASFVNASPEVKEAFEKELLSAASSAVDLILSAASGKLDLRAPSIGCMLDCFKKVSVLLPKDQKLLNDALSFAKTTLNIEDKADKADKADRADKESVTVDKVTVIEDDKKTDEPKA